MTDLAAYLRAVEGDMLKLNHLYCDSCKRTVRTLVQLVRELSKVLAQIQDEAEGLSYIMAREALARAERVGKGEDT